MTANQPQPSIRRRNVAATHNAKTASEAVLPEERRLFVIDLQVDKERILERACQASVMPVMWDSNVNTLQDLINMIRTAHKKNGASFQSIAVVRQEQHAFSSLHEEDTSPSNFVQIYCNKFGF